MHKKIRDATSLDKVLREHDVYASIPGRESLTIDAGTMSPEEAARRIGEHIDALGADGEV